MINYTMPFRRAQNQFSDEVRLGMIQEYRKTMGRLGGRKLWNLINRRAPCRFIVGRDRLFDLLDR